jgi:hypothetical protein
MHANVGSYLSLGKTPPKQGGLTGIITGGQ